MKLLACIILIVTGIGIFIAVLWRVCSRRHELPCPVWLRWMVELDNPFIKTNRAKSIIEHLDLDSGMFVLDAGCGPGRLAIPLAREVGDHGVVVAMDIQDGMLSRTKEKARAEDITNIEFLHAGLGQGKLGKNRFDRALLVTVLGEIPDREKAIQEISVALKPGGILSITELIFDPHFQRRSTVARLTAEAGLELKDFFGNKIAYTMNVRKPLHGKTEAQS